MTESQQWNETTLNFLKAVREYVPLASKPTVWKLVYDAATGKPQELTAGDVHENSNWIEISAKQAAENPQCDPRVRVQDGAIVRIALPGDTDTITARGLGVLADPAGVYTTSSYNMLIMEPNTEQRWSIERRTT